MKELLNNLSVYGSIRSVIVLVGSDIGIIVDLAGLKKST